MREIDALCLKCDQHNLQRWEPERAFLCAFCRASLLNHPTDEFQKNGTLNQCAICGCAHLFRQKDFNRKLGIAILVLGIGLSYWTKGISLLVVTLIDWLLYSRVPEVACCYSCHGVYRHFDMKGLEPFNLSLHDHYRSLVPAAKENRTPSITPAPLSAGQIPQSPS